MKLLIADIFIILVISIKIYRGLAAEQLYPQDEITSGVNPELDSSISAELNRNENGRAKGCKPTKKCQNDNSVRGTCSYTRCKIGEIEVAGGCETKDCTCCVISNKPSTNTKPTDLVCPFPWFISSGQCFHFGGGDTWSKARGSCKAVPGGDLAQPKDIKALAVDMVAIGFKHGRSDWYWLGGSDQDHEGDWRWINGSKIESNWSPKARDGGDCLAIFPGEGANSLRGHSCNWGGKFLCERPYQYQTGSWYGPFVNSFGAQCTYSGDMASYITLSDCQKFCDDLGGKRCNVVNYAAIPNSYCVPFLCPYPLPNPDRAFAGAPGDSHFYGYARFN